MKNTVKQLHTYSYGGPLYRFAKLYSQYWEGETQAVSPEKALNNLTFKAKSQLHFNCGANLELDPSYLLCDDESFEDSVTPDHKIEYCDKCGTQLTDGGYCPKCDDGVEDAYEIDEGYPMPKKLYSINDKKATWDDDAQDFIWWDSEARHSEKYANSYKAKISPKDFLDLTTSKGAANLKVGDELGFGKLKELDIDEFNKETYQPCFLIISFEDDDELMYKRDLSSASYTAKVVGHEGRHRMFALMNAGVEEVDVQIKTAGKYYDKYAPYKIKRLDLIGQFNDRVKVSINNPIVMSWENHKKINPNLNLDEPLKNNYNIVEGKDDMKNQIHLKDIVKNITNIILYNDVDLAYLRNPLKLTEGEDVDDIEDSFEATCLSMSDKQLETISDEDLHKITNIELLDRLTKICKNRLSVNQTKLLQDSYKEKIIIDKEDVRVLIDCIKLCTNITIEDRLKNMGFMNKYKLDLNDILNIIKNLTINDYYANTRSVNFNHLGNNLIIFEPVIKLNNELIQLYIYIKLDIDETTGDTVALVSIHDANKQNTLPYKKDSIITSYNNKVDNSSLKSSLEENIEKHDTLNPKLWDEDGTLKDEVREKILQIANEFIDNLKEDGIKFDLKDIRIVGSNCSYNYTKDSDLDVHLIADSSSLTCPDDLYPLLYSSYRSLFNKNLDIDFYGIPVEIYVEVE